MRNNQSHWADLFLLLSVILGAVVRFAPTMIARSPINDGGMFYAMIGDLKANGFLLPAFTSYNHLNIPFAYPPLSLYVGALLSGLGIPTIEIMRWLPPLVSTLSILAFYWMASMMLGSRPTAALSAMAYALMPRSFSWYVMGGGLSRTFGILFLLLACGSAWALFSQRGRKYLWLTAVFGAAAVLSHPETGLHTAAACLLIWLFKGRSRTRLARCSSGWVRRHPAYQPLVGHRACAAWPGSVSVGAQYRRAWRPLLDTLAHIRLRRRAIRHSIHCPRADRFGGGLHQTPVVPAGLAAPAIPHRAPQCRSYRSLAFGDPRRPRPRGLRRYPASPRWSHDLRPTPRTGPPICPRAKPCAS